MKVIQYKTSRRTFMFREKKTRSNKDLATQKNVMTRVLGKNVKRNDTKLLSDIMFKLTIGEFENWRSQIMISN